MSYLPRRILVGISCEPEAKVQPLIAMARADRHTFEQALWLAERLGAELRLLHVIDFLDARRSRTHDVERVVRDALTAPLEHLTHEATQRGVTASFGFVSGKPWMELLQEAAAIQADLVMLSAERATVGTSDRILHGSTTRRILRKAPCPVWVVDGRRPIGVRRVLALVDRSEASRTVIAAADELASKLGASRLLLHCLDFPADIALHRLPDAQRALRRYHAEVRDLAEKDLAELTADREGWEILLREDWVVRTVPTLVDERKIDLVVLSSVAKPWLPGTLLGTTAEKILERTAVSAWVVRPEGWAAAEADTPD